MTDANQEAGFAVGGSGRSPESPGEPLQVQICCDCVRLNEQLGRQPG